MLRPLCSIALIVAAASGCGDDSTSQPAPDAGPDAACFDPSEPPDVEGPYSASEDFDRDGCVAGALASLDPNGLWFIEEESRSNFYGAGPARIDLTCGALAIRTASLFGSALTEDAMLTDDELFWRLEVTFGDWVVTDAFLLCDIDDDGVLHGRVAHCYRNGEDETCSEESVQVSRFSRIEGEDEADGLELVGELGADWQPAFTANVRVHDGIAYVVRGPGGLRTVDVSDPEAPRDLGVLPADSDFYNDVKITTFGEQTYALVASDASGVLVVDVTDPEDPSVVSIFTPSGNAGHGVHTLFLDTVDGVTLAYLADGYSHLLAVYDVTDPENPTPWASYELSSSDWGIHDLYVENRRAYLNATEGGLVLVDTVETPGSSTMVGRYSNGKPYEFSHSNWVTTAAGRQISVSGEEGYGAAIEIVDVDPESEQFLERIGSFATRPQVGVHNIMAFGDRAYAAWYQDGVRVLDLSDPTEPRQAAYFNTWDPASSKIDMFEGAVGIDVDLDTDLIYVADSLRGLLILRDTSR